MGVFVSVHPRILITLTSGGDLTAGFKATITSVAIAMAATAFGAVGTAYAASPTGTGAAAVLRQNPPPPHRFHSKFRTIQQCEQAANRDHPGRHDLWDCRRGPDRNNPWEYWGS
jgi:hypothetical protein